MFSIIAYILVNKMLSLQWLLTIVVPTFVGNFFLWLVMDFCPYMVVDACYSILVVDFRSCELSFRREHKRIICEYRTLFIVDCTIQ